MPEDTMVKGLGYLESMQERDGHFRQKTRMYSDASNTAYTMVVLNCFDYGKASMPISRGILWLLENQNEDGSWGTNAQKKAFTTTFCLRALHSFYLSGIQRFAKGLGFALDYMSDLAFEEEPVSHVYAPILNLKRIGYLDDELREKFIDFAWIAARDSIAGGHAADAASLRGALKAIEEPDISSVIEEWLPAVQNDDGGFGREAGAQSDQAATALALLAMSDRL